MPGSSGSLQRDDGSGSGSGDLGTAAHQLPAAPWGDGTEKGSDHPDSVPFLALACLFQQFWAKWLDFKVSVVLFPQNSEQTKFFFFPTGTNHHCTKIGAGLPQMFTVLWLKPNQLWRKENYFNFWELTVPLWSTSGMFLIALHQGNLTGWLTLC